MSTTASRYDMRGHHDLECAHRNHMLTGFEFNA